MITSNDISVLIVSRVNDPKRIELVYQRIRKYYPTTEIVIVYDGISHHMDVNDDELKQIVTQDRVYVSGGYNLALKAAKNKYFVFLHDDTFIHKDFINNLIPHLKENIICNFTTVEPPLYGNSDILERPIQNFGFELNDLDLDAFDEYCNTRNKELSNIVIKNDAGGFFMAGYISTLLDIGGFDEKFKPFFFEDSDLMFRLYLNGTSFVQVLNSIVYHLVSRTARHSEDGDGAIKATEKIFIEKWKCPFYVLKEYSMINKMVYKSIRVKIEHKNVNSPALINLLDMFSEKDESLPISKLYINGNKFDKNDLEYIYTLPYIISENNMESGKYELNNMILEIDKDSVFEPKIKITQ